MVCMIIMLVVPLFLGGLCQNVTNYHHNFLPNDQNCGLRSVNNSDIRTLHPWTVAIYTRQSSKSPWKYLVTGTVFSPTAVVTIFGGGFGQPPPGGEPGQKYKIPSAKNVMVVGGLLTTDLLEADDNAQYAPVSYIVPCSNSSEPNDEDYHTVVIRLAKPFDITTPYVRPICVPFFMRQFFKNFGFVVSHIDVPGIMTGFYSPYGRGFYSKDRENGPNYASIFVPGISYGAKSCENLVKFYYRSHAEYLFCGTLMQNGLDIYTCMTHGTVGVWESTPTVISFEPSFGPIPRFFIFGILALVPRRDKGLCYLSQPGILTGLRSSYDYIKGHLKCPPTAFPCAFEDRCIELGSVCDGILDCGNGEDEDPTFCRATSKCDLDNEYQCGLYGKCIAKNRSLDGIQDCPSGSDENPKVSLALLRRTIGPQKSCYPLQLSEGVVANCVDPSGQPVNCTDAVPGTDITLTCSPYYSAAQRAKSVARTCYEDRNWKPVRRFNCQPECGLWGESLATGGFIAKGEKVEHATRFPWHALIFRETFPGSEDFEYICGGSLIERNIIVTAAHCTVDARGGPVQTDMLKIVMNAPSANFQENGKNDTTQIFQVEKLWRPWSFDFRTLDSDIAIIHLKSPAAYNSYVRPICYLLDKYGRPPVANSTGKVPGFGLTENGELSVDLKYIELNVTKSNDCSLEATLDKFCAKASKSVGSLCYGDSGGGIVFPAKDKPYGAHVLKGIVSSERQGRTRCNQGDSATSFTHVDAFSEWILSTIEGIDTNPDA